MMEGDSLQLVGPAVGLGKKGLEEEPSVEVQGDKVHYRFGVLPLLVGKLDKGVDS